MPIKKSLQNTLCTLYREQIQTIEDIVYQAETEILKQDELLIKAERVIKQLTKVMRLQEQSECHSNPVHPTIRHLWNKAIQDEQQFRNELKDHGAVDEEPSKET